MLNQFKELWQSFGSNQKISLVLASGVVVLAMVGMMYWASQPDYQLLYGNLSTGDTGKIVEKLEKRGVKFEIGAGGTSVRVESTMVDRLRAEMAVEGIPGGNGPGFELFDESGFGISDFVQRTNFLRAIQGELARTISLFDGVNSARVSVVMPENRLLSSRAGRDRPTASVLLETSGGLASQTVNSIRHFVANAIQRLSVNDVVVVDSQGNSLSESLSGDGIASGISSDVIRYRKSMESYYTDQVQTMLDRVLGANMSEVRVAVDVDTSSVQTTEKTFDPESQVARSMSTVENSQVEHETTGDSGSGSAGTGISSNTPSATSSGSGNFANLKESEDKNKTRTENFEINEKIVNSVQKPGGIRRLSASVIVAPRREIVDGKVTVVKRTVEDIEELRKIVLTALPITLAPGQRAAGLITITEIDFAPDPFENQAQLLRDDAHFQRIVEMSKNGIGAVLGIGVIIFFMQMLKRNKPEKISTELLQPEKMLQSSKLEDTGAVTPEMLNELIRQKPANIGVSLRQWIGEEAGTK